MSIITSTCTATKLLGDAGVPQHAILPFVKGEVGRTRWIDTEGAMLAIAAWRRNEDVPKRQFGRRWAPIATYDVATGDGEPPIVLRSDQLRAVQAFQPNLSGVLVAPPGWGKTIAACEILRRSVEGPTIVVSLSHEILVQWKRTLERMGATDVRLAGEREERGGGAGSGRTFLGEGHLTPPQVTLVTYSLLSVGANKLTRASRGQVMQMKASWYRNVVLDECHVLPAKTFRHAVEGIGSIHCGRVVGLTATPFREDCCAATELASLIGPVRFAETRSVTPFRADILVLPLPSLFREEHARATGFRKRLLAALNPAKLAYLESTVLSASDARFTRTVIYVQLIDAIDSFFDEIREAAERSGKRVLGPLTGKTGREERLAAYERFRRCEGACVLVTSDVSSSGVDLPECDSIVELTSDSSRSKCHQRWGRALRAQSGKAEAHICCLASQGTHEEVAQGHRTSFTAGFATRPEAHVAVVTSMMAQEVSEQRQRGLLNRVDAYFERRAESRRQAERKQRIDAKIIRNRRCKRLKEMHRRGIEKARRERREGGRREMAAAVR